MKGQLAIFGLFKHEESIGFHSRSDETFTFLIFRSKYILTVVATAWYVSLLVNCEQPSKKSGILFSVTTIFTSSTDNLNYPECCFFLPKLLHLINYLVEQFFCRKQILVMYT